MGHQVTVVLTPDDLRYLEKALAQSGEFRVLSYTSSFARPGVLQTIALPAEERPWLTVFLTRPEDLSEVHFREVPKQHYWTVDSLRSPVIELSRPYFDSQTIRAGRLFYDDAFYDAAGKRIQKSEAFLQWAENVFSVVKKSLRRDPELKAYIGPDAQSWRERTKGKVVAR